MPVLRVLVLAFALAHATGVIDALETACDDACAEGDRCVDGCAPMCMTCQCARCPSVVPTETATAVRFPPPVLVETFVTVDRAVVSPDPREILHVPIARRV